MKKIHPENREKLYATNPIKWTVDNYGSLVLTSKKEKLKITVSETGINTSHQRRRPSGSYSFAHHNNFPGEIPFNSFVGFLSKQMNISFYNQKPSDQKVFKKPIELIEYALREQKLTIITALRQSNIWKKRGFSDPEKRAPKEYWQTLPLEIIKQYDGERGPKIMWKNMLMRIYRINNHDDILKSEQTEDDIINDTVFQKAIELKVIPEVPWGIRKWSNFNIDALREYVTAGTTRSKHWPNYAATCFMFDPTMRDHNVLNQGYREGSPPQKKRDEFLEFLYKWPKTKAGIKSMEEAFNQGMNMMNILDLQPKNPKELLDCTQIWRHISDKDRLYLNSTYQIPKIPLKDGYKYVDHTDAIQISSDYSCCFSNDSRYINTICRGKGFAIYRPHFKDSDKGSLCFFELEKNLKTQEQIWVIKEHRGHGNSTPNKKYIQDMEVILRTINITHSHSFPTVQQDGEQVIRDLIEINPKFAKIIEIAKDYDEEMSNKIRRCSLFFSIEELVQSAGQMFNHETYEWEPTTEEYRQELIKNNNIVQRLMDDKNKIEINQEQLTNTL